MSGQWAGSGRRYRLPPNWPALRRATFERDNWRCTTILPDGRRCREVATDCDHVIPGDDHSPHNLTSLCAPHHREKSAREGVEAKAAKAAKVRRPPEPHPGRIRT